MIEGWTKRAAMNLLGLYALDRAAKLAAVAHFFGRSTPPAPQYWPSLTLVQPVTTGATNLAANLRSRLHATYPGALDHVLVCDAADEVSIAVCRAAVAETPDAAAQIVMVVSDAVALKTTKLEAGLGAAHGEVICSIDDDVALRPGALPLLVRHLLQPEVGAVFGLAAYVWWRNVPSSLMSLFVNHNALMSYVPLRYLTEPFTITGHCYAVRRQTLMEVGSFRGMDNYVDDDHDLAQRIRAVGLRNVQTPMIYDVSNDLPTMHAYRTQMKRWFVFPRQSMIPHMTVREQLISTMGSVGNLVPGVLTLLALSTRRRAALGALGASLALALGVQWLLESLYVGVRTPVRRWVLLPLVVVATPFEVIVALTGEPTVEWRGQRFEVERGGRFIRRGEEPTV